MTLNDQRVRRSAVLQLNEAVIQLTIHHCHIILLIIYEVNSMIRKIMSAELN